MADPPRGVDLPSMQPGVQLLEFDTDLLPALHALVVDHVLTADGPAYWIDAGGRAQTATLREIAPEPRVLERIQVARGFTPYQHYTLATALDQRLDSDDIGLVVCPAFDRLYRDDDLPDARRQDTLVRALAAVAGVGRDRELPVLLTRTQADELSTPIEAAAQRVIRCERTRFGPRFVGDDVETLVYPDANGWAQTTLAFWQRVLRTRVAANEPSPMTPEVTADGTH